MPSNQFNLFPNKEPLARNRDPVSSHLAADYLTASGERDSHKARCYRAVHGNQGLTSRELSQATGIPNEVLHKRLPDLKRDLLIRQGDMRECRVTQRLAVTWYLR